MPSGRGIAPSGSVVLCTRNRVDHLRRCLAALDDQLPSAAPTETIVVDNGSTDDTPRVLADWACADPASRRVVMEPRPGLSRARNAGIDAARHEILLFLDDDAVAPRGWVEAHLSAFRRATAIDAVGGPVVLGWPNGRPVWATARLEHWWSALDHGDRPAPFPPPHGPYGTNMSVRRDAARAAGGFPLALGRRGRDLLSGEEAALWSVLWEGGAEIWYEPATLLVHDVVADKLRRGWILRRGAAQGRTNARIDALAGARSTRSVVRSVLVDSRHAIDGAGPLIRESLSGRSTVSEVLDEAARRLGHATAGVEHLRLHAIDCLGGNWRR